MQFNALKAEFDPHVPEGDVTNLPTVVHGIVERGDQRGRRLGFPTANIAVGDRPGVPPDGVYAGYAWTRTASCHPAALSIGERATFYNGRGARLIEAHLLGFDGDLYDEPITVVVMARIRDQRRFDGVGPLVAQLHEDVRQTEGLTMARFEHPSTWTRGTEPNGLEAPRPIERKRR